MLEIPNLFERHMSLGQRKFDNMEFEDAATHFEEAYDMKDDLLANLNLTKSLIEINSLDKAYEIMKEHEKDYLLNVDYQETYFDLLNKCHYFLEVEKMFLSPFVEVKKEWRKSYRIAKEYQLTINQKKFKELEEAFLLVVEKKPTEQAVILKLMRYFPKDLFVSLAKELLVDKRVSVFSKNELVNQLVQLKIEEKISLLNWEQQLKTFFPSHHKPLFESYQENSVLQKVDDYYTANNPSLKTEITRVVKLHIGYLYPFEKDTMSPVSEWVNSYIDTYDGNKCDKSLEAVYNYQQRIDEDLANLFLFQ